MTQELIQNIKTSLKNELTDKYMTRAEALIYHIMCRDQALNEGYYLDAIHYADLGQNDFNILYWAAKPEV